MQEYKSIVLAEDTNFEIAETARKEQKTKTRKKDNQETQPLRVRYAINSVNRRFMCIWFVCRKFVVNKLHVVA